MDHVSNSKLILGVGSGKFRKDYDEYGYEFRTAGERLRVLDRAISAVEERLGRMNAAPVQERIPSLIGDGREKVTLRIAAEHSHTGTG